MDFSSRRFIFYMIDYITSISRTGSNARQVYTTNSKIKKLLPISHRILSHTARANIVSRKKRADSTGWVVPRQSRSCIPFQLKLRQSAHNLTDIETRQLKLKSEQVKARVNRGSEPYFRFSLWSDCRGSMFARVAARRQRKSLKKESFLFLIFGTFLQRKVHHRFSFPRDKKHGRQKPPASFLFHREFVICLFAFLYDKSVFKG